MFFARSLSGEPHVDYRTFINMVSSSRDDDDATSSPMQLEAPLVAPTDGQGAPFVPKGGAELLELHQSLQKAEKDALLEATLEQNNKLSAARLLLEEQKKTTVIIAAHVVVAV